MSCVAGMGFGPPPGRLLVEVLFSRRTAIAVGDPGGYVVREMARMPLVVEGKLLEGLVAGIQRVEFVFEFPRVIALTTRDRRRIIGGISGLVDGGLRPIRIAWRVRHVSGVVGCPFVSTELHRLWESSAPKTATTKHDDENCRSMPDLLTHALVAYTLAVGLSVRYQWLTPPYVTVAMMGAFIPDLTKIRLLVPSWQLEAWLGLPFDWGALHTVGGTLVSVLIGVAVVRHTDRRRVFGLLAVGASSHLVLDSLLAFPAGRMKFVLWPLTTYRPVFDGLFLSTDRWPVVVAAGLAASAWYLRYYRGSPDA